MSTAEGEDPVPRFESSRFEYTTRNATERHLGRNLRAMYDAFPSQPPSDDIRDLLGRLEAPGADAAE